jgi:TolB-like protein/DNA-binding winged helix-turn-helix (wHTH) protein/tetratricopeptide (TPR) repeat protein
MRYIFGDFCLDTQRYELHRGSVPIPLRPKVYQVLAYLLTHYDRVVLKQELLEHVWPGQSVGDAALNSYIMDIRKALGDDGQRLLRTIRGRGYRFVAPIEVQDPAPPASPLHLVPSATRETAAHTSSPPPLPAAPLPVADPTGPAALYGEPLPQQAGVARRVVALSWRQRALALVGLLLLLGGVVTVWQRFVRPSSPDSIRRAPRLSLVVLPFQNLSGDASQEYYADGITEDLTTDLAHMPGAFVIARTSALSYKGRPVDVQKVGETLGVRYVVEGSLRRIEDVLRVNVQLIATESSTHLWSDRFDVAVTSLAQGQEDIVRRIATTLNVQMVDVESARSVRERPTSPDAFDLILQARALHAQPPSRQRESQVLGLYERALQLDLSSTSAMLGIANNIINRSLGFLGQWVTADELARAATLVAEARAIAPNAEAVLENVALLHQAHEQWDDTATAAARLVEAYPNNASGYELLATAKRYTGHADEALALYDTAIRLNPRNPNLFLLYGFRGFTLLQVGRYDEAVAWIKRSLAANPEAAAPIRSARNRNIAVAHALAGRLEEARYALEAANKLWPFSTVRSNVPENLASPVLAAQIARYQDGARLAGLRDPC